MLHCYATKIWLKLNSSTGVTRGLLRSAPDKITVNRNTIPGETRSPFQTSGLRIGTAAISSRGMGLEEMDLIAELMHQTLTEANPEGSDDVRGKVEALCRQFPLPY